MGLNTMETPEQTEARQMAAVEHFFGPGLKFQAMLMVRAVTASNRSAGMVLVPKALVTAAQEVLASRDAICAQEYYVPAGQDEFGYWVPDESYVNSGAIAALRAAIAEIHEVQAKIAAAK